MNPTAAFDVHDTTQIAEPRRVATWLAEQLGFGDERAGRVALLVSELGTNLAKHARSGEILLSTLSTPAGEREGVAITAVDHGPGIPDVAISRRDGYSTSGTLGQGLGAIERLADTFELYTAASGTVARATIDRERRLPAADQGPYDIAAVQVSKTGEDVCGDAWSFRMRDSRLSVLVADGLGHGLHAHDAAVAALNVFGRRHEEAPGRVIEDVHAALRPTRGAAVAMLAVDRERGTARYAGLGNISASILPPGGGRHNLVSHPGTAGHTAARIQEFNYPVPADAVIVMASDGLGTHWDLRRYPGLETRCSGIIAGVLYRDFSRRRDDVTVVVAKARRRAAEKQ